MTIAEPFLDTPKKPPAQTPSPLDLSIVKQCGSEPHSPIRTPRTRSIDIADHSHDLANQQLYQHHRKVDIYRATADAQDFLQSARIAQQQLLMRESLAQSEVDAVDHLVVKHRPEPPGTPMSPRAKLGPRDAKAPPRVDAVPNVMAHISAVRTEQVRQGNEYRHQYASKVADFKQKQAKAEQTRLIKQRELLVQAQNLSARKAKQDARKVQVFQIDRAAQKTERTTREQQVSKAAALMAKIKAQKDRVADARVHAWRVQIATGHQRWNVPLASARAGAGMHVAHWPTKPFSPRTPDSPMSPASPRATTAPSTPISPGLYGRW